MRRQRVIAIPLLLILLAQSACGTPDAKVIVSALNKALAITGLPHAQEAITIGNQLIADLEAGGSNASALITSLISAWDLVVADAAAIPDGTKRTLVMLALLAGDYALHKLADKYHQAVVDGRVSANPTLSAYRRRPLWRCRSSVDGQFKPMDFCKKNPATSQVETR